MTASIVSSVIPMSSRSASCSSYLEPEQLTSRGQDMADEIPTHHHNHQPIICLDSPTYSIYSDGEYCHAYAESTSSVDGSSRPGSDRFHLGGEFSSYDSDTCISSTSSECEMKVPEQLLKLKSLHRNQELKRQTLIVISDDSSDDETPPCSAPYKISIPLNSVTLEKGGHGRAINKTKRSPAKLSLSHFATSRKKMRQSSSSEDLGNVENSMIPRTPISLKLKKSALSNQWHPILTPVFISNKTLDGCDDSDGTPSEIQASQLLDTSLKDDVANIEHQEEEVVKGSDVPFQPLLPPSVSNLEETPEVVCSSSNFILLSADDQRYDSASSYSQSNSTSTSESVTSCKTTKKTHKPPAKILFDKKNSTNNNTSNKSFTFENVFRSLPPELTVINGDLQPVQSLSVKGLCPIPTGHPVHSWKVGTPVGTKRPPKKYMKKNVRTKSEMV